MPLGDRTRRNRAAEDRAALLCVCMAVVLAAPGRVRCPRGISFSHVHRRTSRPRNGRAGRSALRGRWRVELHFYVLLPLFAFAVGRLTAARCARSAIVARRWERSASLVARRPRSSIPWTPPTPIWRLPPDDELHVLRARNAPGRCVEHRPAQAAARSRCPAALAKRATCGSSRASRSGLAVALAGYDLDFLVAFGELRSPSAACVLPLATGGPLVRDPAAGRPLACARRSRHTASTCGTFPLLELLTDAGASPELGALGAVAIPLAIAVAFLSLPSDRGAVSTAARDDGPTEPRRSARARRRRWHPTPADPDPVRRRQGQLLPDRGRAADPRSIPARTPASRSTSSSASSMMPATSIEEIELVVITHQHIDHLGLVEIIAARSGAEVAAIDVVVGFVESYGDRHRARRRVRRRADAPLRDPGRHRRARCAASRPAFAAGAQQRR